MDSTISPWKFGVIVGGVVALLILVVVLVVAIALLRRYLHRKQNSRYSQHVEDGTGRNSSSLSRVSFGVLWSLYKSDSKGNSPPVNDDVTVDDVQPQPLSSHVFAADQPTIKISSQDQPIRLSSQIPSSRPSGDNVVEVDLTGSPQHSEAGSEAFYHTLESPVVTAARQSLQMPTSCHEQSGVTKERHHSSHSYSSISSDIPAIPPPPVTMPAHRRGRRYSLPNTLLSVTHNSQHTADSVSPNYINYRGGRRNSDPSVTVLPSFLATPGIRSPADYEKPIAHSPDLYTPLDMSGVVHHAYTPLVISGDPFTPPEHLIQLQPLQMSSRPRVTIGHLRMNSIPEENNNYERLQPTPKPKY